MTARMYALYMVRPDGVPVLVMLYGWLDVPPYMPLIGFQGSENNYGSIYDRYRGQQLESTYEIGSYRRPKERNPNWEFRHKEIDSGEHLDGVQTSEKCLTCFTWNHPGVRPCPMSY